MKYLVVEIQDDNFEEARHNICNLKGVKDTTILSKTKGENNGR